jgi:hypothetical protein
LDALLFLADHTTSIGALAAAGISGIGAWLLSLRNISATVERTRIAITADESKAEVVARAAFRSSLIEELAKMRELIKECETDRDTLRLRLSATEGQILVLKASNEIMERWIAFFNERGLLLDHVPHSVHSAKDAA